MSDYTVTVLNADDEPITEFETDAFEIEDSVIRNTDQLTTAPIDEQATAAAVTITGNGVGATLQLDSEITSTAGGRFGFLAGELLGVVDEAEGGTQ